MDYLQFILVPESIIYLISEDFKIDLEKDYEKVFEIMEDSEEFGSLIHGEVDADFSCDSSLDEGCLNVVTSELKPPAKVKETIVEPLCVENFNAYKEFTSTMAKEPKLALLDEKVNSQEVELKAESGEDMGGSVDAQINLAAEQDFEYDDRFDVCSAVSLDLAEMNSENTIYAEPYEKESTTQIEFTIKRLELEKHEEELKILKHQASLAEIESKKQSSLAEIEVKLQAMRGRKELEKIGYTIEEINKLFPL
jgi:hypothetical protein